MTWTRLSDDFYDNESVNSLSHEAHRLHVYALVWSNKQLTDGRVTRATLRRLLPDIDTAAAVDECVAAGLWTLDGDGGVQVRWDDQETAAQVMNRRKRNAEQQARFRDRRKGVSKGITNGVSQSAPSRPDPPHGEGTENTGTCGHVMVDERHCERGCEIQEMP